jgi:hypothetical protein
MSERSVQMRKKSVHKSEKAFIFHKIVVLFPRRHLNARERKYELGMFIEHIYFQGINMNNHL